MYKTRPARHKSTVLCWNWSTSIKMIKFVVLACLVGVVLSAPAPQAGEKSALLEGNFVRDDFGQYSYNFLTNDGVARTEQGSFKPNAEGTANILVQRGGYRYVLPSGELVEVNYIADENGYRVL